MKETLNVDFSKRIVVHGNNHQLQQVDIENSGAATAIILEQGSEKEPVYTAIENHKPNSSFSIGDAARGEEIFILSGDISYDDEEYFSGTYIRRAPNHSKIATTKNGCAVFVKRNHFRQSTPENIVVDTTSTDWLQGHGKLQVMPLAQGPEGSTLVKWPANEVFVPHKHHGGEEIFVLSGTFIDEHGSYPPLSWVRSPHLSEHHPRVEEECIIFVKVGHLPI